MKDFTDAKEMAKNNPDTFTSPTDEILENLEVGDYVKVCVSEERFWVIINEINQEAISGTIDNDLVLSDAHGLKLDDKISFEKRHIYQVFK